MLTKDYFREQFRSYDFHTVLELMKLARSEQLLQKPTLPDSNYIPEPNGNWLDVNEGTYLKSLPSGVYCLDVETVKDNQELALASAWDILNQKWWTYYHPEGSKALLHLDGKQLIIAHRSTFEQSWISQAYQLNGAVRMLCTHVMACNIYHPAKVSLCRARPNIPMFRESNDLSLETLAKNLAEIELDKGVTKTFIQAKDDNWRRSQLEVEKEWVSFIQANYKAYTGRYEKELKLYEKALLKWEKASKKLACSGLTSETPAPIKPTRGVILDYETYVTTYYHNSLSDGKLTQVRDYFKDTGEGTPEGFLHGKLNDKRILSSNIYKYTPAVPELFRYNLMDVVATVAVFDHMWAEYSQLPYEHIAGLYLRSSSMLPVAADWFTQLKKIEECYTTNVGEMMSLTAQIEQEYMDLVDPESLDDRLDWGLWTSAARDPLKVGKLKWVGATSYAGKQLMKISRLFWKGRPLFTRSEIKIDDQGTPILTEAGNKQYFSRWYSCQFDGVSWLSSVRAAKDVAIWDNPNNTDKGVKDTTGVFSKSFAEYWGKEILTSESPNCKKIADIYKTVTYWQSFRTRAHSIPIYHTGIGLVAMPRPLLAGTVTNRSIDPVFLTMSKPSEKKVGSELYNWICAPEGMSFVSADLDSIQNVGAALIAAQAHAYYNGLPLTNIDPLNNEFSRVTLLGDKDQKTTMAWLLAKDMGLDNAEGYSLGKNALYALLFGVGLEKLSLMMGDGALAAKTIQFLKGTVSQESRQWSGGIGSEYFNFLPMLADGLAIIDGDISFSRPRSLFLRRNMPNVLKTENRGKELRGTANNAVLQGLDVDLLNSLVVGIYATSRERGIFARHCQTVHDFKQFLTYDEHAEALAEVYQVEHEKTITRLLQQMGMDVSKYPVKGFRYSGVEISKRWVKTLSDTGVTLSCMDGFNADVTGSTGDDCGIEVDELVFDRTMLSSKEIKAIYKS